MRFTIGQWDEIREGQKNSKTFDGKFFAGTLNETVA